jgi:hypothetical protein
MKNATPNHESNVLPNDQSTTTPRQCNQIAAFIESNPPVIECSFTYEVTR